MRNNQDTLCVDLYHNVCDAVTRGDINAAGLGKRIILPHTFTGGPRTLTEFQDLPQPNPKFLTNIDNRLIRETLAFDMHKSKLENKQLHSQLNPEQRVIYKEVVESVYNKTKGQFYFVYGPSNTGKTFLYKTIISRLRLEWKIVLVVASSGIASLLLPARRTAHSKFVIPLELLENSTCGIKQNTHLAELMKEVLAVGDGKLPAKMKYREDKPTWIEIPENFLINSLNSPIEQIVTEMYHNFIKRQRDDAYLRERAILTPRNDDADIINAYMFEKLEGESVTYNSADEICKASIDTLDQQHLYPRLNLKKGTPHHGIKES
ncbi:ATP-dependent DNA helicase PIF1-like protein [Tanacetum coccineum]